MIITALAIVITFSIVVFVHELGHFFTALKYGVKVEVFSLGFGPELLGKTHKGIRYRISAVPLGGYVKLKGENAEDENARENDAFMGIDPLKRIVILAAGAGMNFLTGIIIFFLIIYFTGMPQMVDKPVIGAVGEGTPAQEAGLQGGDRVLSVNGKEVGTWTELSALISESPDKEIKLRVKRDSRVFTVAVKPEMNDQAGRALIGIAASFEVIKLGFFSSLWAGIKYTALLCWRLIAALWLMITGRMAAAIAGPVGIAQVVSQAAGQGLVSLFQLIALISVNLGFINLFPIPILDGGHIIFALIEKIKGAPLDQKKVNIANMVGLAIIMALFIFATWQDILRLFIKI